MSEVESYTKLGPDTEFADQHAKLESVQAKFQNIEEEHTNSFNTLKAQAFAKKASLFNELREVYKTIPQFWYNAIINTSFFAEAEDHDDLAELLKFISDVEVEYDAKNGPGGKIHIHFSENPFLSNQTLTREIYAEEGNPPSSSEIKIKSAQINWKEGKEIAVSEEDEEFNPSNDFLAWLQSGTPLETDFFFMQDFYPEAVEYFRGRGQMGCDDFSGSLDSQDDLNGDFSGDESEEQEDEQPAFKKSKH